MFSKEDILCSDKYLALESSSIAYIKTDVFYSDKHKMQWRGRQHTARAAPVWISGHSDYGITPTIFNRFSHATKEWFTINKEHTDPHLHSLPLGITNNCTDSDVHPILGNVDIMLDVMSRERTLKNLVYMNFTIETSPEERRRIYNMFDGKPWVTTQPFILSLEGRKQFLENIRNHRFVLCPRGNGVDTHRLWETLYMGSIPIVVRHTALAEFQDLPICWIDNWSQVTQEFLESEFKRITEAMWNMDKLKFGYWRDRILACV